MSRVESPSTSNVFVRERTTAAKADMRLRHPEPFRERPGGLLRGPASLGGGSDADDDALGSALDGRPTGSGGHTHRDGRHVEV